MTHMSGLSYHFVEEFRSARRTAKPSYSSTHYSLKPLSKIWRGFRSLSSPGSRWRYSVGIDVVGRLIEVISGRPLGEFLRERLFEPLGMTDTGFGVPPEKRSRLAAMYGRPDLIGPDVTMGSEYAAWMSGVNDRLDVSKSYPVDSPDVFMRGGVGLFSTIGDYFRFAQMLANGGELDGERIIGRKTLELMHRIRACVVPAPRDRRPAPARLWLGLGSRVLMDVAQSGAPGSVGEFGWSGAAKTHYWVDPKEQLVGLFMTQSMMSFDLPEFDLRALAYQAIDD